MKTVSNGLIPQCQKDVHHIVSPGRVRQLSPHGELSIHPSALPHFILSPKQEAVTGLNWGTGREAMSRLHVSRGAGKSARVL